jgi:hypothetical protein
MDTSETYIKMCEKATEIQKAWNPNLHDFVFDIANNKNVWGRRSIRVITFVSDDWFHVGGYQDKSTKKYYIGLPRQDQLQGMLEEKDILGLIFGFKDFCDPTDSLGTMPHPVSVRYAEKEEKYIKQFTSMEQLWLAFVMKNNYKKVWNGVNWISHD